MLEEKAVFDHDAEGTLCMGISSDDYDKMYRELIEFGLGFHVKLKRSYKNSELIEGIIDYYELPRTKLVCLAIGVLLHDMLKTMEKMQNASEQK